MSEITKHLEKQLQALKLAGIITCYRELAERATTGSRGNYRPHRPPRQNLLH